MELQTEEAFLADIDDWLRLGATFLLSHVLVKHYDNIQSIVTIQDTDC